MILYLPSTLHPNPNAEVIADTGCTGHYFSITAPAQNIQPDKNGISVTLPDGNHIKYKAAFLKDTVEIINLTTNDVVLTGHRKVAHGNIWIIPLQQQYKNVPHNKIKPQQYSNTVYKLKMKKEIVQYLHGACFSPTKLVWIKAIKQGHFATWPGLTAKMVEKHLPKTIATEKGHLQQQLKNLQSTRKAPAPEKIEEDIIETTVEPKEDVTGELYGK
eukprot:10722677-Ditylum_brightwellii.AAC.1